MIKCANTGGIASRKTHYLEEQNPITHTHCISIFTFLRTYPSCVEALRDTRRAIQPHSRASVYEETHSFSTAFAYMRRHKHALCFPPSRALPISFHFLMHLFPTPRLLSPADAHIQAAAGDRSWTVFGHRGRRLSAGERGRVSCLGSAGRRRRSEIKLREKKNKLPMPEVTAL